MREKGSGFNRNIVECKGTNCGGEIARKADLIETLWNVKFFADLASSARAFDLIETLWNVKFPRQIR